MAKEITKAELLAAIEAFCAKEGWSSVEYPPDSGQYNIQMEGDGIATAGLEGGKFKCTDEKVGTALREIITENRQEAPAPKEAIKSSRIEEKIEGQELQESAAMKATANPGGKLGQLLDLFDSDILEIFGDTGVGKTIFCQEVAEEAAKNGYTVVYVDTEKNVGRKTRQRLAALKGYKEIRFSSQDGIKSQVIGPGFYYLYTPVLSEISTITRNLPNADLIIIDSLGMPVLAKYSRMKQNEQGHALQEMIAIKHDLKTWCYLTGGLAIDINQPVSDMNKTPQQIKDGLPPFGDKSGFATKSVIRFCKIVDKDNQTIIEGRINKGRDSGKGVKIVDMEITNAGVNIKIKEAT
jgi:RecA/RadA recombinase